MRARAPFVKVEEAKLSCKQSSKRYIDGKFEVYITHQNVARFSPPSFSLLVLGETKCLLHVAQTNSQLLTPTGIKIVLGVVAIGEDQRPIANGFFV